MMSARKLAHFALLMLQQIEKLAPMEQARVMRIAVALLTEEVQQALQQPPARDE